jgi:hypothetical protein
MNLFKQVRAFSRGRYAAHLFTNCIHRGEEMVYAQKEWEVGELLFLLSLLAVRHMLREYVRTMSKNTDNEHLLEELSTLHPCFINIFAVIYGCLLLEKDMFSLSQGVSVCQASFPLFLYPLGILQSTHLMAHAHFVW